MCRWLAYSGAPIAPEELIFKTRHSLIDQSLAAQWSVSTTNGDGFGLGWYDDRETPGIYKHIQPAWNDGNLRDLCHHVRSRMFLAHVRSATGTAVQRSNCHPFRIGRWLLVHNGRIAQPQRLRRDVICALPDELVAGIEGNTDSELMLLLAWTFGLEHDAQGGIERMVGFVEDLCRRRGIPDAVQMTLGLSDGERLYAARYGTDGEPPSLYHSRTIDDLRHIVPMEFRALVDAFSDDARAIVSEPLTDLSEPWQEIPKSTFLVVESGDIRSSRFEPQVP